MHLLKFKASFKIQETWNSLKSSFLHISNSLKMQRKIEEFLEKSLLATIVSATTTTTFFVGYFNFFLWSLDTRRYTTRKQEQKEEKEEDRKKKASRLCRQNGPTFHLSWWPVDRLVFFFFFFHIMKSHSKCAYTFREISRWVTIIIIAVYTIVIYFPKFHVHKLFTANVTQKFYLCKKKSFTLHSIPYSSHRINN